MENLVQENPDIKAVFAHNDEVALGALQVIQSSDREVFSLDLMEMKMR